MSLWAAREQPMLSSMQRVVLCNRNMSVGRVSTWKAKPCLVVASNSDQFFLNFEGNKAYKQSQSKGA